ncbi:unannotated protein [freshwater metagenome]|uniref:Unannotated protein n=1 Tax=freshwater metagenome TaxID=449393 RepID=A0A6J6FVP9_9ZZZZ
MSMSIPEIGPGSTRQTPCSGSVTVTPRARRQATVISMWGIEGRCSPVCLSVRPLVNRAPARSNPETNWLDCEASIEMSPPSTRPVPWTVKGRVPRPSSSTSTPNIRRLSIVVAIGRSRAPSSPSKVTDPFARAARGGTNRITVPANPQSIVTPPVRSDDITSNVSAPSPKLSRHSTPS